MCRTSIAKRTIYPNVMCPIYDADQHMKTQIRKQVRAKAGKTMRQVQAEAKRKAANDSSGLILTGLAVEPPSGLDEVKVIAEAVQKSRKESVAQDNESSIADRNTTKAPFDVSQEDMSSSLAYVEVFPKVLDTTSIGFSTDIEGHVTSKEIEAKNQETSAVDSSNGTQNGNEIIKKTTKVPDKCVSTAHNIECEAGSCLVKKESKKHENEALAIQTIEDVQNALLDSNVLVHE